MKIALRLLLIGCVGVAGCGSPEATRTRGGRGADVGNRPEVVEMHEGARPFWKTPDRIAAVEHPPLEPAEQADKLSRE
jgi:hypothetical protein